MSAATITGARDDLAPFRSAKDGEWGRACAAHLARRAAFGTPPALLDRLLAAGPEGAPALLLESTADGEDLRLLRDAAARVDDLPAIQAWWLYRMMRGPTPARDKLALFWHNHFATSNRKVEKPRLMLRQVDLFLALGAGPFPALLDAIARDPAMLIWLDGNSNRSGHPNENFARELFELFTLGIGNYTEQDIQEAARAFTGWHVREDGFRFHPSAHDAGEKACLGIRGRLGGDDVLRLAVEQPACARYLATRLFRFYVHPAPEPALCVLLGEIYRECGLDTGAFLRRLWASRLFYSVPARRALISAPTDFLCGSLRTLAAVCSATELAKLSGAMGQDLLRPPSVKGWDQGTAWLSSTALLARYRFAAEIAGDGSLGARLPWAEIEERGADGIIERLFPDGLDAAVKSDLVGAAGGDLRLLLSGCLQLPEYQEI